MQEYITNGTVILQPVSPLNYKEGLTGVVVIKNIPHIVKLANLNIEGNYDLVGDDYSGELDNLRQLFRFAVIVPTGIIQLYVKDWKTVIQNELTKREGIQFKVKPFKFKSGNHIQTCSECYGIFEAAVNQPYCKKCCYTSQAVAYLNDKTTKEIRIFDEQFVRYIAQWSLVNGYNHVDHIEFNEALNKEIQSYKNGSNTTENKPKG